MDRPIYGCLSVFSLSLNLLSFESIHFVTVFISCWAWYSLERKKEGKKLNDIKIFRLNCFNPHTPTHTPYNCNYFYHDCPLICSPSKQLLLFLSSQPIPPTMSSVQVQPSTSANPEISGFDIVRCSRCQRSMSLEKSESSPGIVRFGMNSYYCSRCATMVGFTP